MERKVGLVLSGGGARGLAHIGVLKVLQREGIPIDIIAGTSMGAILGAAYGSGKTLVEIENIALKFSRRSELIKLLDLSPRRRGLLEGHRVREFLADFFGDCRNFDHLKYPMAINAVDLKTGEEIVFTKGELLPALYATSAIPGIFSPVSFNNHILVDGGVLNNLPVDQARKMGANLIIAVNVHTELQYDNKGGGRSSFFPVRLPGFFQDSYCALIIMMNEMTHRKIIEAKPEIVLYPKMSSQITSITGFTHSKDIIKMGEICTEEALDQIYSLLAHVK